MTDSKLKSRLKKLLDITAIASCTSGLAIAFTYLGLFQNLELSTLDFWFRLRSIEPRESRIVVVTIGESDLKQLQQWPISDTVLSQLITKITRQKPRAIGLDIYRDFPVEPGIEELEKTLLSTPNIIGVEKAINERVSPPPILAKKQQTALADLTVDADGKVRRGLLSIRAQNGEVKLALAPKLALMYLEAESIQLQRAKDTTQRILGKAKFIPFQSSDGGYVRADSGGFQILLNFRGRETDFNQVSIMEVLNDEIPSDLMSDHIVILGSVAASLNDSFFTPLSNDHSQGLPGVFIHANIASQILSEALDGRSSIKTVEESLEWLWVFIWTGAGSFLTWTVLSCNSLARKNIFSLLRSTTICLVLPGTALLVSSYLLFLSGWWLPVVTSGFSLIFSTITIGNYYNQNQKKLAYIDGLTQIPNRRFFDRFLQEKWQQHQKKSQPISLILCDIDYFKKYNDTYGHQAGDLCLKYVAQGINKAARANDLPARYGGEEFVIVLSNTNAKSAMLVAQRICNIIGSFQLIHESSLVSDYVTLSCGVASTSMGKIGSCRELIAIADAALYQAKEQGRDRAVAADRSFHRDRN